MLGSLSEHRTPNTERRIRLELDFDIDAAGQVQPHQGIDRLGARIENIDQPDQLTAKMNTGYEDWLGEIGATGHFTLPELSPADRLVGDNILPGSDRRGRPAETNRVRI